MGGHLTLSALQQFIPMIKVSANRRRRFFNSSMENQSMSFWWWHHRNSLWCVCVSAFEWHKTLFRFLVNAIKPMAAFHYAIPFHFIDAFHRTIMFVSVRWHIWWWCDDNHGDNQAHSPNNKRSTIFHLNAVLPFAVLYQHKMFYDDAMRRCAAFWCDAI